LLWIVRITRALSDPHAVITAQAGVAAANILAVFILLVIEIANRLSWYFLFDNIVFFVGFFRDG
jgi:hypothetical protein